MDERDLAGLLDDLFSGARTKEEVMTVLRRPPYSDLGFARVDHHRALLQGFPEAVYGPGKSPEQCAGIVEDLLCHGSGPVLITRADESQVQAVLRVSDKGQRTPAAPDGGALSIVSWRHGEKKEGKVLLITAGTADLGVAEECAATLRAYGIEPDLRVDCGVAGIHRLLSFVDELLKVDAVVVFAGMEGALASVVGGLTPAPVIAVPTSAGYGAGLEGVTALLSMHASCVPGITVVGIDNGFGAACAVARLLH